MSEASLQDAQIKNFRASTTDELIPSDLRDVFNKKLHLYQRETVNFLILRYNEYLRGLDNPDIKLPRQNLKKLTGFIVGHEMGLGKTIMVLFFLRCVVKHPHPVMRPQRIIIVVQKILIHQWKQEISKWCQAIPLYTYHGTQQKRQRTLMSAKNERVCIILTTYAMISNDGKYIMSTLKDGGMPCTSLIPALDSESSSDSSSRPVVSATSDNISNNETGSTEPIDQESSNSSSSLLDPTSEFSWMIKKQSRTTGKDAASVAAHRLGRLSLQASSEPNLKQNVPGEVATFPQQRSALPTAQAQTLDQKLDSTSKQSIDGNSENLMYLAPPSSSQLPKHCIDILIMDEATAIKNTATKTSLGLRCIDAGFKLALTGTPVMNNLAELWAIVDYINPGYFGKRNQFDKNIARPINNGELQDATAQERSSARKVRRALRDKLYPILIRHTTADLKSLGVNKITITFWIPLTEVQFILYGSAIRTRAFQEIYQNSSDSRKRIHLLHLLRKICDNPCELSTEDAAFFKGNLEKAILTLKQKATQPQTCDSDYLQALEDLQISKIADQDIPQHGSRQLNKQDSSYQPISSINTVDIKNIEKANALDAIEQDYNDGDGSDDEQDAQDWEIAHSLDDYLHKSPDHYDLTVRSITALSSKYALFMEIINHIRDNNHRALIFCDYHIVFNMLEHLLSHNDIPYLRLDGTVADPSERSRICNNFNTNKKYIAFLISIKLGSMGLNITGANRIILLAPAWSLKTEEQAIARAYRMGQERNVVVYKLACINTMEEQMVVRQLQKAGIANVTLDNEKHQSVIKKTDLDTLFEFNFTGRLEGHLPDNIRHHAKPEHVRETIQQALGSSQCTGGHTEAEKELDFVNSLTTRKFCTDVSVLDYLHSKANIDNELDISEQASSQLGGLDYDKILSTGLDTPSKPVERPAEKKDYTPLVSIYIESHQCTYFRSTMEAIFNHCRIDVSNLDKVLDAYYRRVRDSMYRTARNTGSFHAQISRPFILFVSQRDPAHVAEWQRYFAWAVLSASVKTTSVASFLSEFQAFNITSYERLEFALATPEFQRLYSYFKFQLNSIISHYTIEVKKILIAETADICEICSITTEKEYSIYLHNLVVSRIKLFISNTNAFEPTCTYPATLNIICSLCQSNNVSLATLVAEYDNPQNWVNSQFKSSPQIKKERKRIPLLWGPLAGEFANAQKFTLTTLLQQAYGNVNYAILDKCLLDSRSSEPAPQAIDNAISLAAVTECFETEINNIQISNTFSSIKNQYALMNSDVKELILRDTYQKLCYYQTLLPNNAQHTALVGSNDLIIVSELEKLPYSTLPSVLSVVQQRNHKKEHIVNAQSQPQPETSSADSDAKEYEDDDSIDILA